MIDFLNPGSLFYNTTYIIQVLSIFFVFVKNDKKSLIYANTLLLVGLSLSLLCTIFSPLFGFGGFTDNKPYWNFLRFDNLSLLFLFIIQLIAIPVSIYNQTLD